ncbi:hypothetical protein ABBQ38_007779 [Trebouxia sp. C0009 RCD-2024]
MAWCRLLQEFGSDATPQRQAAWAHDATGAAQTQQAVPGQVHVNTSAVLSYTNCALALCIWLAACHATACWLGHHFFFLTTPADGAAGGQCRQEAFTPCKCCWSSSNNGMHIMNASNPTVTTHGMPLEARV